MKELCWQAYETYAQKLLDSHQVKAATVGVAVKGKTIYQQGFGLRGANSNLPVGEDTIFGIGSITKSVTAVAIMQLHEQGKLSVTDSITKHLPEFRYGDTGAENSMTIHHFLTHTAGMPPLPSLSHALVRSLKEDETVMADEKTAEKLNSVKPIDNYQELMEYIAQAEIALLGAPGQYFSYSNDCWALLGSIIENISGQSYEAYCYENIIKPAGMTRTVFESTRLSDFDNVADLYTVKRDEGEEEVIFSPLWLEAPSMTAAGFLKSTVADMLRYMEIFRNGGCVGETRILSQKSVEHMTTPYAQPIPSENYLYGYGLMIHPNYNGVSLVEHGGNIKGVAASVTCVPEKGITTVALANTSGAPSVALTLAAVNNVLGVPVDEQRHQYQDYLCPPAKLAQYAGKYASGEGSVTTVTVQNQGLLLEVEDMTLQAKPVGVDMFAIERKGLKSAIYFYRDMLGEVWGMANHYRLIPRMVEEQTK